MLKKLSSRKLWACVAGILVGLAEIFGLDNGMVGAVTGAVTAVGSVIAYIVTEGRVDAAAVTNAAQQLGQAAQALGGDSAQEGQRCG